VTDQPEDQAAESASPAMTVAEADAALTGPGGFFEIVTDNVGGIETLKPCLAAKGRSATLV